MDVKINAPLKASREGRPARVGGPTKSRGTRSQRTQRPYTSRRPRASKQSASPGGQSIKSTIEVTGADIHISGLFDTYPGTHERVVYISGDFESVSHAVAILWNLVGRVTLAGKDDIEWNPKTVSDSMEPIDEVEVEGKITIPLTAAGAIIGVGGATIKGFIEESGASITVSNFQDEPKNTSERVVTISGKVSACTDATDLILSKLAEDEETSQYVTKGSKYPTNAPVISDSEQVPRTRSKQPQTKQIAIRSSDTAETLSAVTTITVAVPNPLLGNILGKHGATLKEITSLSGASITISKKGEYIEGTNNRVVTISGTPVGAQTAHTLISNILSSLE